MVRVMLEGGDLADLVMPDATDAYVNVAFRPDGATYDEVFDPQTAGPPEGAAAPPPALHGAGWDPRRPTGSRSTSWCTATEGSRARGRRPPRPGDVLVFTGPSGGYRPDPDADWHLFVGDESALPAIAASLEALAPGARAVVRLVCDGPEHEIPLPSPADVDVHWLHRAGGLRRHLLSTRSRPRLPAGRPFGFVHGEADEIRAVRHHLLHERGLTRADLSCSPYWRRTMTDEAWRRIKRDYVAAMEAEAVA